MCAMEVEWSRRADDKPSGEIDMGGRIGVIPYSYNDPIAKEDGRKSPQVRRRLGPRGCYS